MVREERSKTFNIISPVAVEFASQPEPSHELTSSRFHTRPCRISGGFVKCSRSIGDNEYLKTFLTSRQSRKCDTNLGNDTRDDQLLLTCALDRLQKVFVVLRVDLAGARDVGGIGKQFFQLRNQKAVRTVLETGREDSREI